MALTQLDTNQIVKQVFDEQSNSNRVTIVGLDTKELSDSLAAAIGEINYWRPALPNSLAGISNDIGQCITNQPTVEYTTLEIPTIIKEPQIIYVDRPVVETKIVEVEKPIVIEKTQIIEIEKQIVVREQQIIEIKTPEIIKQYESIPNWIKLSLVLFLGMSILTNILLILKK